MNRRHQRLVQFLDELLQEFDPDNDVEVTDDTSLIRSELLDSLAILMLAEWIDGECAEELDITGVDIAERWNSVDDILAFIGESEKAGERQS